MDLKCRGIDGCEMETIYPVNTGTAKSSSHFNLFVKNPGEGKVLAVGGSSYWKGCGIGLQQQA